MITSKPVVQGTHYEDVFDILGEDKARADYAIDNTRLENTGQPLNCPPNLMVASWQHHHLPGSMSS